MKPILVKDDVVAQDLWKWMLHEDILFHTRSTIFIATQAFLFSGAATAKDLRLVISGVGLIVCALWLVTSQLQERGTIDPLKFGLREYGKNYPDGFFGQYRTIAEERSRLSRWISDIFGITFPVMFVIAWIVLVLVGHN